MEALTSLQNPKFKRARALHSSRGRKQQQRFIVFGWREIARCLDCRFPVEEIFVGDVDASIATEIENRCHGRDIRVYSLSGELQKKLAYGDRECEVIATVNRQDTALAAISVPEDALIVVLESVEKPGNVGAVFRTADAVGAHAVVLANPLTDLFHPNAIRASMGTVFSVPFAIDTSSATFDWLKSHGIKIMATRVDGTQSLFETDLSGPTGIVFGNEARGLGEVWHDPAVHAIHLPMKGISDSLNLSNTAAVCLYESFRQRVVPSQS